MSKVRTLTSQQAFNLWLSSQSSRHFAFTCCLCPSHIFSWLKVWHLLYLLYHFRFFLFLKNCLRSPAIVVAFLMKSKGWRLPQSYQWVKERRPSVDISQVWIEIKYNIVRSDINCKLFSEVEITK
ncbi:hypothetical protein PVK06_038144 [Gossypium arboreum]|uniref:Uncharacterized protein n=1 Tax=Gossypium arboreum TaxID=29729 RepID=A0ABR0MZQ8_GOSAR|nr:hypothetical protein PVK06_038144 [Gossypium arboreum]